MDFHNRETATVIKEFNGIQYFINEFWTSRQRQANRIHEISYRACFKPQLPAFFIDRLTRSGDIVYDPFMGRGTTPIEAALRGRIPYGNDINPLSRALVEPRINPPSLCAITQRLQSIPWDAFNTFLNNDLLAFFHPHTLAQIEGLKKWLSERQHTGRLDQVDKWIRMVALNRLTGHSSGFFSVYTLPPNQAISVERQKKINIERQQIPSFRDVPQLVLKKSKNLLSTVLPKASEASFSNCESYKTHKIPTKSVTLTVTSPPFLDVVDYESDNWLRCWFLGIDVKTVKISKYRRIDEWQDFIHKTLCELERITKSGGYVVFEVGEIRNATLRLDEYVIAVTHNLSFEIIGVMINQQNFTKTSNCWGIYNNKVGTNSNRIVLLRRI